MTYTTLLYFIFIFVCLLLYYSHPVKGQWRVLLIASLVFYITFSEALVLVMIASALIVYLGALTISKITADVKAKKKTLERAEFKEYKARGNRKKKTLLTAVVIAELAFIGLLKYGNFFGSIANSLIKIFTHSDTVPMFSLIVPLGISYYTLMCIGYITDVYRGKIKAERNFFKLLLFVCYFPHIIEGPFDRYDELAPQFEYNKFDYIKVKNGAVLLMFGLFKKFVIANRAGVITSNTLDNSGKFGGTAIALGILVYTLQLYADFSGCIEIVSGTSEMFGITLAQNFRQPFFSRSVGEFWRRWHITLGGWLKDYVFYPAATSKGFSRINGFSKKHFKSDNLKRVIPSAYALFFVWFCMGLWHGASGKFIVYGLYYYVIMMLAAVSKPLSDKALKNVNRESKPFKAFQLLRTFALVNIGMLIFRGETISESARLIAKTFTSVNFVQIFDGTLLFGDFAVWDYLVLTVGVAILLTVGLLKEKGFDIRAKLDSNPLIVRWLVYLALIFATLIFGVYGGNYENTGMIYAEF